MQIIDNKLAITMPEEITAIYIGRDNYGADLQYALYCFALQYFKKFPTYTSEEVYHVYYIAARIYSANDGMARAYMMFFVDTPGIVTMTFTTNAYESTPERILGAPIVRLNLQSFIYAPD